MCPLTFCLESLKVELIFELVESGCIRICFFLGEHYFGSFMEWAFEGSVDANQASLNAIYNAKGIGCYWIDLDFNQEIQYWHN